MRAKMRDVDQAVLNLHRAIDRLVAVWSGDPVPAPVPQAFLDLQAREAVAREWQMDPCGFRHGVGFREYAETRGFA